MTQAAIKIATGFARHLASYEDCALAQRQIASQLADQIGKVIGSAPKVIELGHGTGFLTAYLLKFAPRTLWLNDLTAPCPNLAWPAEMALHHLRGNAEDFAFPQGIDLVASASMLQWLPDPAKLTCRAFAALRKGGLLAVSSFGPDMFPELSRFGLGQGAPSYQNAAALAQSLPSNAEIILALDDSITLTFPDARALFAHLRATGVNGLCGGRLSPPRLRAVMRQMEQEAALTLTYRPSYCIARKL